MADTGTAGLELRPGGALGRLEARAGAPPPGDRGTVTAARVRA